MHPPTHQPTPQPKPSFAPKPPTSSPNRPPARPIGKLLFQLAALAVTILIALWGWRQYQRSQNVDLYLTMMGGKLPPATRLMHAAKDGDLELVQSLLDRGADITLTTRFNRTALYFAIDGDNPTTKRQIIELLLDAGIDPNYFAGSDNRACTLQSAISRTSTPEDEALFTYIVNHTPHDLSNHFCRIASFSTFSGLPQYLEIFLDSLDPDSASFVVQGVRSTMNLRNAWYEKFIALPPETQQQLNTILDTYQ